jgi:hypothetical protein
MKYLYEDKFIHNYQSDLRVFTLSIDEKEAEHVNRLYETNNKELVNIALETIDKKVGKVFNKRKAYIDTVEKVNNIISCIKVCVWELN